MTYPGPCCICGGTDYELSCGGPTICPQCDCGNFTQATVLRQVKEMERLRSAHDAIYLRGWNEGVERAAELLDEEGSGTPAEKIRTLIARSCPTMENG